MAFEKVSPQHVDKMCDRLAGAIVDLAYSKEKNPRIAVEVLAGHGKVFIIIETSLSREQLSCAEIDPIVWRIFGNDVEINVTIVPQDPILAHNQDNGMRVADNGLFRGVPPTHEQKLLTAIAASIYEQHPSDGKYIIHTDIPYDTGILDAILKEKGYNPAKATPKETREISDEYERRIWKLATTNVTVCQSHVSNEECFPLLEHLHNNYGINNVSINPLGEWTGGPNTDSGATNRKLGSDMGDGVTGGGLHGKDLSKGDVSINIVCFLKAVQSGQTVTACCSIGDEHVTFQYASGKTETETFADVVKMARLYIMTDCGGSFERFSEWGLLRP